jgi:hypothetical protein
MFKRHKFLLNSDEKLGKKWEIFEDKQWLNRINLWYCKIRLYFFKVK